MFCLKCGYRPTAYNTVLEQLNELNQHFNDFHKKDLNLVVSPVCLIGKDKE